MSGNGAVSAQEAIQRAREIAARLSGQPLSSGSGTTPSATTTADTAATDGSGSKRKRWGVLPDGEEDANKKPAVELTTKRLWVTVTPERPAVHYIEYITKHLPPHLVEAARSSEEDSPPESSSSSSSSTKLSINFKGKGSSNTPVLPGMPEEPFHILLVGLEEDVQNAENPVDALIVEAASATIESEAIANQQRALVTASQLTLAQLQGKSSSNSNNNGHTTTLTGTDHTMIGGTSVALPPDKLAAALLHGAAAAATAQVHVPNGVVGFIIGRGGENIASMQAQTGCKVQIQKEHELQPGQTQRVITLSAATDEQVAECRTIIENMVAERVRATSGGGNGGGGAGSNVPPGHVVVMLDVPDADVGLIIGKGGMTIKSIQEESGASIQVPKIANGDKRSLTITHPNDQGANYAKSLVENVLSSKPSYAGNNNGGHSQAPQSSIQVPIPDKDVGLCIGRQGCVIKHMQTSTHTRIQIPQQPNPGEYHRVATVTGPAAGTAQVQQMIERIVAEQSSASVMSGAPFTSNNQQYQQQPQENQQGYSAEWAAYHAAQAAAAAAQQQQQQAAAQQQQVQPQAAAPAGADEYREQFFRYAYYYGEDAARQYYGAWSPPVGTPNPYGVNPNGTTAAPAAAPVAAAAPAPAVAAPAYAPAPAAPAPATTAPEEQHRETSRRHVSNLPAWMTKK